MSRRASLPGADELFRATGASARHGAQPQPRSDEVEERNAQPAPDSSGTPEQSGGEAPERERHAVVRRRSRGGDRRPTGRERHDEKITVYCSADELIELERARLGLRGDYGIAVDRGRIVREAIAIVLEDLEARGGDSSLARRLQHR